MISGGFITLHREALSSWLWTIPATHLKVAISILAGANWKTGRTYSGGKMVTVKRGQMMTSIDALATATKQSKKVVRSALSTLVDAEFISEETTNKYRIITVLNYNKYQDKGSPDGTTKGNQQGDPRGNPSGDYQGDPSGYPIEQGNKVTREQGNQDQTLSVADGSDPLPVLEDELRAEVETKPTPPTSSAKTRKPKPPPTETATRAAKYLQGRILEKTPNCAASRLTPKQLEAWARTLDKLEGLSPEHTWRAIKETVDWLQEQPEDGFAIIVQSPTSLSEKWDRIQAKRKRPAPGPNGAPKPEDPYERAARIREQQQGAQ